MFSLAIITVSAVHQGQCEKPALKQIVRLHFADVRRTTLQKQTDFLPNSAHPPSATHTNKPQIILNLKKKKKENPFPKCD